MAAKGSAPVVLVVQILLFMIWSCLAFESHVQYEITGARSTGSGEAVEILLSEHAREKRQADVQQSSPEAANSPSGSSMPDNSNGATPDQDQVNDTSSATSGDEATTQQTTPDAPAAGVTSDPPGAGQAVDPTDSTGSSNDPFADADVRHDNNKYYTSDYMNPNHFEHYWTDLQTAKEHKTLSAGHRVAAVIPLKFDFRFYGHEIKNVTVATGGFIYMSPFLHQWLTATQYIAPLMANFDPSLSVNSSIYYESLDTQFTVEWKNVMLQDQQSKGQFHFQASLFPDSSIQFAYKSVPSLVSSISKSKHPVKAGLSDAYYNDTYLPQYDIKRRTIYEYHKVALNQTLIRTGSVIKIIPVKTCNTLASCDTCSSHTDVVFDCKWCNKIGRCSDGMDWYRQHWNLQGCKETSTSDVEECPEVTAKGFTPTTVVQLPSELTTKLPITAALPTKLTTAQKPELTSWFARPTFRPRPMKTTSRPPTMKPTFRTTIKPTTRRSATTKPLTKFPPKQMTTTKTDPGRLDSDSVYMCAGGRCKDDDKKQTTVIVVLVVAFILVLVGAAGGWVYYAYTHPTSRSGMWLMEHRPSQIKAKIKFWKSSSASSAKYQTETDA
ncbi:plexin domain-containing protein 2 isoform X1 [Aplysia californica]|uniref:Plexin domain-containing protein 2 isoform X1 n=1 Tax=Aplysia californica TaxID=6500 RepID=A0ABM0JCE6_APLCA|nr:plexin domain-containing protein 2 isoform X1 [Aplysia californica]